MAEIRYVSKIRTFLVSEPHGSPSDSGSVQLLLGARLHVDIDNVQNGFAPATTVPNKDGYYQCGFVDVGRVSVRQQLKVFYVDVGQGDATLIEAEGAIVLIDGGPNKILFGQLVERLETLKRANQAIGLSMPKRLRINAIVVSHFDTDHYRGLTHVLKSDKFKIGCLYHNGIPRYHKNADKDLDLGDICRRSISTDLRDICSARALIASGKLKTNKGNLNYFGKFIDAAVNAFDDGRLEGMEMLCRRNTDDRADMSTNTGSDMTFEILAPVTSRAMGRIRLPVFPDPHKVTVTNPNPAPSKSHTINGNSVVLRMTYGKSSFLFGGDLNQPAQLYLKKKYGGNLSGFQANVNKACHHGSSDFDIGYVKAVAPFATVFSSGDNGSYDHPQPDAIGVAAKYSKGNCPLVFSTELIRETGASGVKLGHVNARSNGQTTIMAQKKEKPTLKKTWHTFELPYAGPF